MAISLSKPHDKHTHKNPTVATKEIERKEESRHINKRINIKSQKRYQERKRGTKELWNNENNEQNKMIILSPYKLTIILNVSGLNSPIKR